VTDFLAFWIKLLTVQPEQDSIFYSALLRLWFGIHLSVITMPLFLALV